jgi:uncharacterized protein YvpB
MRAVYVLFLGVAALSAGCASSGARTSTQPPKPPPLAIFVDGKRLATLRSVRQTIRLPARLSIHRGAARIAVRIPPGPAKTAVRRARAARKARVDLPFVPLSSSIAIRPVRQVLRDDCEATSLSMILTAAGIHVSQLRLQDELPISGPLDPEPVAGSSLFRWGDPERGFVGRADGSGPNGGFGVYEPPIRRLAARYGVHLLDLQGKSVAAVRRAVLSGEPVLAWVGLAAGPYASWLTPSGREITVNYGEHAVALVGATATGFWVDNPLSGREFWSNALFSYRWSLLGHRALALPPQR